MTRTESPYLPHMTHMLNVPSTIPDWRQTNGKVLGHTEFERSQFKIIEPPKRKIADNCHVEITGTTRVGKWITTVTPDVEMFLFPSLELFPSEVNNIAELLTIRQSPYVPKGGEKPHADAINFLMRNWKELRFDMYPERPKDTIPPYRFSEVFVDPESNKRADFVGIGPDGRIIVIEFGVDGKHEQALGYKGGLERLFSDFEVSITAFVAYYSQSKDVRRIHIKAAYNDHMDSGEQAVKQFINRQNSHESHSPPEGWKPSSLHEFELFVTDFQARLREINPDRV